MSVKIKKLPQEFARAKMLWKFTILPIVLVLIGFSGTVFAMPEMSDANNLSWSQFKWSLPSSLWLAA